MGLEQFYFIAQIVAGLAVVGSLIYVGIQIHQSTRATRLAGVQAVQSAIGRVEELIIRDAEFADMLRRSMGETGLSDTERVRVNVFYRHALRTYQSAHYQYVNGALEEAVWIPQARTLSAILHADRGIREFFETERYALAPEFATLCDELINDEVEWPITSGYEALSR
jgi:hypothetical protein